MRIRCLAAAIGSLVLSSAASAQSVPVPSASATPSAPMASEPAAPSAAVVLDPVVVVASRDAELLSDVAATVSVIGAAEIERIQANDLRDLFRYEPGVTVGGRGRFDLSDIRIRGLGGNRVQIRLDGVSLPDAFAMGPFANAGRDFVDVSLLRQVEVLRGPASALYGSDALGGTVSLVTRDPVDFLEGDEAAAFRLRSGYSGVDRGTHLGLTGAARAGAWSWLVHTQFRDTEGTATAGTVETRDRSRTVVDPTTREHRALLAKAVWDFAPEQRLRFTVDAGESQSLIDVASDLGTQIIFGRPFLVLESRADDQKDRQRLSLDGEHAVQGLPWLDALRWQLHRQDSETTQQTFQRRDIGLPGGRVQRTSRDRLSQFHQEETGLELLANTAMGHGEWTWGASWVDTDIAQLRDGGEIDLATGLRNHRAGPDVFPVRDIPLSAIREWGVFAQYDIVSADGLWRFLPALRHDRYTLSPETDAIFAADNPGRVLAELETSRWSPKLGVSYSLTPDLLAYANLATGFRAPPQDANIGFTNVAGGYTTISNPDLRPETSRGLDLGLRGSGAFLQWSLAVHLTRYRDFIQNLRFVRIDPATGLRVFQSQNLGEVEIWGAEASARLDLAVLGWDGGFLRLAAARSRGIDRATDTWLDGMEPTRGVLGLGWRDADWGWEVVASAVDEVRDLPPPAPGSPAFFIPDGHVLLDLLADAELGEHLRVEFGVFNLADETVWERRNVVGLPATSTILERFSQPGRHARVTVTASF